MSKRVVVGMNAPVLPIGREDGYYLASPAGVRFVPLDPARRQPTGEVIPFPQFFRAIRADSPHGRKVKRDGKTIWLRHGDPE